MTDPATAEADEIMIRTLSAAWLAAIAANPALGGSVDPLGHGPYGQNPFGLCPDEQHRHHPGAPLCPNRRADPECATALVPPPGALTYRPSAALATMVRALHRTCVFPGCAVPSDKCELDHRVPFDKKNPAAGGWTIRENLQPLCKSNHQDKTDHIWESTLLPYGIILWTSRNGTTMITMAPHAAMPPSSTHPTQDAPAADSEAEAEVAQSKAAQAKAAAAGQAAAAKSSYPVDQTPRSHRKCRPSFPLHTPDGKIRTCAHPAVHFGFDAASLDPEDTTLDGIDIEMDTWWETNQSADTPGFTLADLAIALDADIVRGGHCLRDEVLELRRQYRIHTLIMRARYVAEPPPF